MIARDFRGRIYQQYARAREQPLAPASVAGFRPRAPYLRKLMRDHFPAHKGAAILDLGCGHGAMVYFARQEGYHNIVGVDVSPEQVAEARRLGIDGVRQGDAMEALGSLGSESQDLVIAFDLLEHFAKEEIFPFLDQVNRVLKSGGRFLLHAPNGESPFMGRILYGDFTHEMAFTRSSLNQLLRSAGFSQVSCYEDAPIPHGVKSFIRFLLWKGFRGLFRLYIAAETGVYQEPGIFSQNLLCAAVK